MRFSIKLILLSVGLVIMTGVGIAYFVHLLMQDYWEQDAKEDLLRQTVAYMRGVDMLLFDRLGDLRALALDPLFCAAQVSPAELRGRLVLYRNTYKIYTNLSYFDKEGVRLANSSGLGIGQRYTATFFLARQWERVMRGEAVVGATHSALLDKDVLSFAQSIPCGPDHTPQGVLITTIALERLHSLFDDIGTLQKASSVEIDLVDRDHRLLYSNHNRKGILQPYQPAQWQHELDKPYHITTDADRIYVSISAQGFLDYKGEGWSLLVSMTRAEALAGAAPLHARILAISLLCVGLAILVAFWLARYFTRPIHALVETVLAVTAGLVPE